MSCTVIVGGQYGSEGKGKVTALLAAELDSPWIVRCGGPNSGHSVNMGGRAVVLRQVPAGIGHPKALMLLSAGCVIDEEVLIAEATTFSIPSDRLVVDPRAVLISQDDRDEERKTLLEIGSTLSGTGAALVSRMARDGRAKLAGSSPRVSNRFRVEPVAPLIHAHLGRGGDVIVEGTQGFGLSLLHGPDYPYVTARDTTAAAFISEVGLSPRQVDRIIMVVRTFPIRVGGPSGPLKDEITWEEIQRISGAPQAVPELTSVTKRLRRVGRFDMGAVRTACRYNEPTSLAVMGLDRLDYANYRIKDLNNLSTRTKRFLEALTRETSVPIEWVGTGFSTSEAIHVRD
jgi:adenylosuccinate synthase